MNDENKPTFSDIRILSDDLIDLVKNINFKNSDLYEKNKYLEQELKKANERITDLLKNQSDLNLPADEGQGDSFLILGAIMETMNDFMSPLIYLSSVEKYPVSIALKISMDASAAVEWNKILAMSVIVLLPSLIIFFFAQKYFVDGVSSSGLKE